MKVTIPAKALQRIRQVAKENHSQNVNISVAKGHVNFELCETGRVITVDEINKGGKDVK